MVLLSTPTQHVNAAPTAEQVAALQERTNDILLNIIRTNINTQYASQAILLTGFRGAVLACGGTEDDDTLLTNFRTHVPLSTYDPYEPFINKLKVQPCKEKNVENLLAPGLPDLLGVSSSTSGTRPKILPKYKHSNEPNVGKAFIDLDGKSALATMVCTGYRDVKEVERAPGEVIRRIPVCIMTGGLLRRTIGWYTDDDNRLSQSFPGYAVPWAATVIGYFPSFLIIHGLFWLARRDIEQFLIPFSTTFIDLFRRIDEQWEVLVSCIRDGKLPDLEGIDHAHFIADPERAAELLDIGPPFSREGWFALVWPKTSVVAMVCSGTFVTGLPKVRSILGPTVALRSPGYFASEVTLGFAHDANKLDEFVLNIKDVIEFLDDCQDETHINLRQVWELEVGKRYEPILTTRDGLWRYRLGDIIEIVGFDSQSGVPIFKSSGRRSLTLRFPHTQITDLQLLAAIERLNSEDVIQVNEFTTMLDDRALPPSVCFLVELAGPLGAFPLASC
ncbi:GH3 auxin-responsive promoter [Chiua virens]|nr:GH3 auxin-responsive promoter [Chiua virens]